ncbi:hypothetical protein E2C01_026476 [Portunus trituberculatus]|uniref:Secreted protein n=1 Tax=Portunus trituberculatus TaxID=210409 RepID=A0A5B7EFH8_PORTR|nr:hypothetical protein [Portunus trituberculatus]
MGRVLGIMAPSWLSVVGSSILHVPAAWRHLVQHGTSQASLGGEVHADVAQQVLLVTGAVEALGTRQVLLPVIVSLEVPLDVAAHGGLVRAVRTRVRLFSRVLPQGVIHECRVVSTCGSQSSLSGES